MGSKKEFGPNPFSTLSTTERLQKKHVESEAKKKLQAAFEALQRVNREAINALLSGKKLVIPGRITFEHTTKIVQHGDTFIYRLKEHMVVGGQRCWVEFTVRYHDKYPANFEIFVDYHSQSEGRSATSYSRAVSADIGVEMMHQVLDEELVKVIKGL